MLLKQCNYWGLRWGVGPQCCWPFYSSSRKRGSEVCHRHKQSPYPHEVFLVYWTLCFYWKEGIDCKMHQPGLNTFLSWFLSLLFSLLWLSSRETDVVGLVPKTSLDQGLVPPLENIIDSRVCPIESCSGTFLLLGLLSGQRKPLALTHGLREISRLDDHMECRLQP